ncbi:phosphotransferase [Geomonas silvestris]|uniref:Phosphotransferase n=1 Tax=Geomonas silvestris TaxID=2740184 RepID=A0A6V8MIB3_9BACT|nr:phosphotransferase [Geomonas silvestris]GFO59698.1 phosphotransferase [Geomonas silvestris]
MLLEMHCHTSEHSSCSTVPAVELVRQVHAQGLQGLVITDHHFLWNDADLAELLRQAGVPGGFLVLSGQETNVPRYGDLLIYGASEVVPRGTPLEEIRRRFPDCAIVWAHPYRDGRVPTEEMLRSPLLTGIEIFNSNHTVHGNSRSFQDWRRFGYTATAGTDTHAAGYAGIYPTRFDVPVATLADLVHALRSGSCRPYLQAIAHREAHKVIQVKIGSERSAESRDSIIIRTPADQASWTKAQRAYHIMLSIGERGFETGSFRVPQAIAKDAVQKTLIEQGVAGRSLFEMLVGCGAEEGRRYLELAARWLARLHTLHLKVTGAEEFLHEEERRLAGEVRRFEEIEHPYRNKVAEIAAAVRGAEKELVQHYPGELVQGHGDYQPQNIIIGRDDPEDPATCYLAAIDFERSQLMPPAFDVGWFLAQFRSQFNEHPEVRLRYPEAEFLATYRREVGDLVDEEFPAQLELFRARANLSIAAYLVKLKLGEGGVLWRILVESERSLLVLNG